MFIELQFAQQVFAESIRRRIKRQPILLPYREFDYDFDGTGNKVKCVVDSFEIIDSTTFHRQQIPTQQVSFPTLFTTIYVPHMQMRQAIKLKIVKISDLEINGIQPTSGKDFPIFPIFNISLNVREQNLGTGGPAEFSVLFDHVDFGLADAFLSTTDKDELNKLVRNNFVFPPFDIGLTPLSALLHRPITAIRAGITCDIDEGNTGRGEFVAIRIVFNEYTHEELYTYFFTQNQPNLLQEKEWAVLIDSRILTQLAHDQILNGVSGQSKFALRRGPFVSWNWRETAVYVSFFGEAIDACAGIDMDINIGIRITQVISPQSETISTHYHFNIETADVLEDIGCLVSMTLFWDILGTDLFIKEKLSLGKYLGGFFAPLLIIYGINVINNPSKYVKELDEIQEHLGANCRKIDENNYVCDEPSTLEFENFGLRLIPETIYGTVRGPVITGKTMRTPLNPPGKIFNIEVADFVWTVDGSCKHGFYGANKAQISISAGNDVLINAEIIYDLLGEFRLELDYLYADTILINIRPSFKNEYIANPYPCIVRIITSVGMRIITIPNLPKQIATQEEKENLDSLVKSFNDLCKWKESTLAIPSRPSKEIEWIPTPRPNWKELIYVWQAVVRNLYKNDQVTVINEDDSFLMSANAASNEMAHLTLAFKGNNAPKKLKFKLTPFNDQTRINIQSEKVPDLFINQFLFLQKSNITMPTEVQELYFAHGEKILQLICSTLDNEYKFDISTPDNPILQTVKAKKAFAEPLSHLLYSGKEIINQMPIGVSVALEKIKPQLENEIRILGNPKLGGFKNTLFIGHKKEGVLYNISDPNYPEKIQIFHQKPWFEGTAFHGKLLAQYDLERKTIGIYELAASKTI